MKKILEKILLCAAVLTLSGCVRFRTTVNVDKDGNIKQDMTMLFMESMLTMDGSTVEDALADMLKEYEKDYNADSAEIVREGEGENAYAGIAIKGIIPEDNGAYKVEKNGNRLTISLPLEGLQEEVLSSQDLNGMNISLKDLKKYGAELTMDVVMPGKPETNAGTVEGNTVKIDLLDLPEGVDTITVSCSTGMALSTILLIGGGALGIIAVVMALMSKKKPA